MAAKLTGGTDLLTYYDLVSCYKKYINQSIDPTLSSFVADLPGKTTVEADGYMMNLLRDPHIEEDSGNAIQPFDSVTLKDAYHLKDGPVPGFDVSLLGLGQDKAMEKQASGGSDSERKHRKKKKKRKHSHDHHDEDGHGDHKKKRKRKKERDHSSRKDENEGGSVIVD